MNDRRRRPRHRPVVTDFRIRPVTYPEGHWMNRFWGPLAYGLMALVCRVPIYRYVLRPHPEAAKLIESGRPVIFTCIHQDIFDCYNGLPRLLQDRRLAAIVSYSRDGGLAAMALRMLGYRVVRGSSSRGGGEGLLMLRNCLHSGFSVVMAADGPKAPLGDIKPGVVALAGISGAPILPVRAWGWNRLTFRRSWTRAAVSLPLLPVTVAVGPPLHVETGVPAQRPYQIRIARTIAELARWTSLWAGGPARAPFKPADA